jgi:hypothetical protein
MSTSTTKKAPPGFKWVCCRYRRVKNSQRMLDAHEYGYEAWCFLVPSR